MLPRDAGSVVPTMTPMSREDATRWMRCGSVFGPAMPGWAVTSVVGHADTAAVIADDLGTEINTDRRSVKLATGDKILVAQYSGPRLPEGATSLSAGASIGYWLVVV